MNKHNIIVTHTDSSIIAEWSNRSLDDSDRYAEDSIILVAKVDSTGDYKVDEKRVYSKLAEIYDQWIRETRN